MVVKGIVTGFSNPVMPRIIERKTTMQSNASARINALMTNKILMFEKFGNITSFDVATSINPKKKGRNNVPIMKVIIDFPILLKGGMK